MTRVYERAVAGGGARILILGAGHYPFAQTAAVRVPKLADIPSAAQAAIDVANDVIGDWADRLAKPLASVDMLVCDPAHPDGIAYTPPGKPLVQLQSPTLANVKSARDAWLNGAGGDDLLLFYCCGHGIWLPSASRTFLASDFGQDGEEPWSSAIALDDFMLALPEKPPRLQWLLFDCCANTPPDVLEAQKARANPLIQSQIKQRAIMEEQYGDVAQVTVAAASRDAEAFGKEGRGSRFSEVLLEACRHSGYRDQGDDGRWWLDQQSLDLAMASYGERVAPIEEEDYFTFARLTTTDALTSPRLLSRQDPPGCVLFVNSDPAQRLKQGDLAIRCVESAADLGGQAAGQNAQVRYRQDVAPWRNYRVEATFPEGVQVRTPFAQPPIARAKF